MLLSACGLVSASRLCLGLLLGGRQALASAGIWLGIEVIRLPGPASSQGPPFRLAAAMAPKRKLKRNVSKEHLPVEQREVTCIRGGVCKSWQVVEVLQHLDVDCVSICARQAWLHNLLAGQVHHSPFHAAIANFVTDCAEAARLIANPEPSPPEGAPAPSQGPLAESVGAGTKKGSGSHL